MTPNNNNNNNSRKRKRRQNHLHGSNTATAVATDAPSGNYSANHPMSPLLLHHGRSQNAAAYRNQRYVPLFHQQQGDDASSESSSDVEQIMEEISRKQRGMSPLAPAIRRSRRSQRHASEPTAASELSSSSLLAAAGIGGGNDVVPSDSDHNDNADEDNEAFMADESTREPNPRAESHHHSHHQQQSHHPTETHDSSPKLPNRGPPLQSAASGASLAHSSPSASSSHSSHSDSSSQQSHHGSYISSPSVTASPTHAAAAAASDVTTTTASSHEQFHFSSLEAFMEYIRSLMLHNAFSHTPKTLETSLQPPYLHKKLLPFQLEALNWMTRLYLHFEKKHMEGGFILADEMGLGKTIQVIAFLSWYKRLCVLGDVHHQQQEDLHDPASHQHLVLSNPVLIIVPLSTLSNWCQEFEAWSKNLSVLMYHASNPHNRYTLHRKYIKKHAVDVIVTTYEVSLQDHFLLSKYEYSFIIADEAHRLKNPNIKCFQKLQELDSIYRILLTGTPFNNNLIELFALMNFIMPHVFVNLKRFKTWFRAHSLEDKVSIPSKRVDILHSILRPLLLRREKAEVDLQLPPNRECIIYVGMTPQQKEIYDRLLKSGAKLMKQNQKSKALTTLMDMRKVCNHPFLMSPFQYEKGLSLEQVKQSFVLNSRLSCQKFRTLIRLLKTLHSQGHRVLIFSLFTSMLDIIEHYLRFDPSLGEYRRLDGSTPQDMRRKYIKEFSQDENLFCFLISSRAGGLGITLTAADTVILYDSDWNPQNDLQSMARCSRIGQTRMTHVYRFVTADSVESKIQEVAHRKLQLERVVIHAGRFGSATTSNAEDEGFQKENDKKVVREVMHSVFEGKKPSARGGPESNEPQPIQRTNLKRLLQYNHKQAQQFDREGFSYKVPAPEFAIEEQRRMGYEFVMTAGETSTV